MRMLAQDFTFVSFIEDFDPESDEHVAGALEELQDVVAALYMQARYLGKLNAEFAEYMMNPSPDGD